MRYTSENEPGDNLARTIPKRLFVVSAITMLLAASLGLALAGPKTASRGPLAGPTLAERLGYPADAKLLIVHADDLGVSHSEDAASMAAFEKGMVNSGSIMMPCPWVSEVAAYVKTHPDADLGLHLTLTSEWATYKWGPVAPKDKVPTLLGPDGYLYPDAAEAAKHIDPKEAEIEVRAQVERALALGIKPTHLDAHMGTLFSTGPLFQVLTKVAHDYKLPVLVANTILAQAPFMKPALSDRDIVIDRIITISPTVPESGWASFYENAINTLQPGVTEFIIHIAYDDDEMRAVTVDHPQWGAAWRQRDYDFFTGAECRKLLDDNNIKLVTWRQIGKLLTN
jgi:chitin disaccharide deacetylase